MLKWLLLYAVRSSNAQSVVEVAVSREVVVGSCSQQCAVDVAVVVALRSTQYQYVVSSRRRSKQRGAVGSWQLQCAVGSSKPK